MKNRSYEIIFVIVITAISIIFWFIPTGYENPELMQNKEMVKTEIVDVDNYGLEYHGIVITGSQKLKIKVLEGKYKGQIISGINILMGQKNIDKIFKVGDKALSVIEWNPNSKELTAARADDMYRLDVELILFVLFGLFLILFAKWTGVKALLSFVFTAMAIWKVLIPLYLSGHNPVWVSLAMVIITTTIIVLLIAGFTRKALTALIGTVAGILFTTILSILFGALFKVPGTVKEFSELLLYTGFAHLNLTSIFLSGIFISSAGAVMDVTMDISAAQHEIAEKKPDISRKELIRSGFNISRLVIGTMATTLLFAYSGSFSFLLMVFMAKGMNMTSIFNMNLIAAEILQTLVGSFGLVMVAPITSIVGGYIFVRQK